MNWLAAKLYDPFMSRCEQKTLGPWRRELLDRTVGRVLEVGAGTGINLRWYPDEAEQVVLSEPAEHMRTQLRDRLDDRGDSHRFVVDDRPVEQLDVDEEQFDAVVVTLVLCSVDDPLRALEAMYRVLKPGGALIFIEHVASDRSGRRRVQGILEPVWKVCAGNCHLTRRTSDAIREVGFEIETMTREQMESALPFLRPSIRGVARRPEF